MGQSIRLKCIKCGEEVDYTTSGVVMSGPHKVFHYQCPECHSIQEEWVKNWNGKAKRPSNVICDKCGKPTKAISLKSLVCPNCGTSDFEELGICMLD